MSTASAGSGSRPATLLRSELAILLPTDSEYEQRHAQAVSEGAELVARLLRDLEAGCARPGAGLTALGVSRAALALPAGLGLAQARGLAAAANLDQPDPRGVEAAALLNLLVGVFDLACDRDAALAARLAAALAGDVVPRLLAGETRLAATGSPAADLVLGVGQRYVDEVRGLRPGGPWRSELTAVLRRMLAAELASLAARRSGCRPDERTWRTLRDKSVLPAWGMALTAMSQTAWSAHPLATLRAQVEAVGELLWIVDDLLDARPDWEAGVWSRPWILLARSGWPLPHDVEPALARLAEAGIAAGEARRALEAAEAAVRFADAVGAPDLAVSLAVSVESWLRGAEG